MTILLFELEFATTTISTRPFPRASSWAFRGYPCSYVKAGSGPPVLLVHGFAGSAFNCWRETLPALAESHTVYGIDLLGLGASSQPSDVTYSIDLWREQCEAFVSEMGLVEPPVVVGHSFGSLIALELAAAGTTPVRAVGMMNCGIGMNNVSSAPPSALLPVPPACPAVACTGSRHGRARKWPSSRTNPVRRRNNL